MASQKSVCGFKNILFVFSRLGIWCQYWLETICGNLWFFFFWRGKRKERKKWDFFFSLGLRPDIQGSCSLSLTEARGEHSGLCSPAACFAKGPCFTSWELADIIQPLFMRGDDWGKGDVKFCSHWHTAHHLGLRQIEVAAALNLGMWKVGSETWAGKSFLWPWWAPRGMCPECRGADGWRTPRAMRHLCDSAKHLWAQRQDLWDCLPAQGVKCSEKRW